MKGGYRYGAGRPASRPQTGWAAQIDVRKLARNGTLNAGAVTTWKWNNGLLATIEARPYDLLVRYRYAFADGEREVSQTIQIQKTPCQLGGSRPWFACPRCQRKVAILYLWGWPRCRTCCRMAYPSQSEDAIGRSWGRTRKIEKKLGAEFPAPKPKWMRRATYERLWDAACREEEIREDALVAFMARMPGLY